MGMLRGQKYVNPMLPAVGIQLYADAITAKAATKAAWETIFNGVKKVATIQAVADVSGSLNNQWCKIYTPAYNYILWLNINGAGSLATVQAAVAGAGLTAHKYIEITGGTNIAAADVAKNIDTAINLLDDMTSTRVTDTVTITNVYGGVCDANADGVDTTGFTFGQSTAGAGTWAILEEASENPIMKSEKDMVIMTSKKSGINATEKVTVDFYMLNYTAHNYSQARLLYHKKSCNICFYDPNIRGGSVEIVHDVPINVVGDEIQGVKAIHFTGEFSAGDIDTYFVRYDYTT